MKEFFSVMRVWNSVAPYQCMLTSIRGGLAPIVYLHRKLHLIIPNSEYEPFISGFDQGLIISAVMEGISWNNINCVLKNLKSPDGAKFWKCELEKDGQSSDATGRCLYLVLVGAYSNILEKSGACVADTDPVLKANFSIPPD